MRTPLTSIKGGLGLVLSGKLGTPDARLRRLVQIAYENCDRLTRLVNDILDMQKIESGRIEYSPEPLELMKMVERAIEANRPYAQRFGVRYVLEATPAAGAMIEADRGRFLQIMDNLLSNAAKFSNPGETVEVTVDCDDEECRIGVRDHGRGISPEQQEKLFVAFSQVDASDQREREGSGLGLAIAKRLVKDMGGRIGLTSALGEGSEFHVIFFRSTGSPRPKGRPRPKRAAERSAMGARPAAAGPASDRLASGRLAAVSDRPSPIRPDGGSAPGPPEYLQQDEENGFGPIRRRRREHAGGPASGDAAFREEGSEFYLRALSVIAWVQAPCGSFVITGSEPPASRILTVRS
ncbi:sensor histidine kinase [Jhaorihella thermophila]